MLYPLARSLLFTLPPETAHALTLRCMHVLQGPLASCFKSRIAADPVNIMGLHFPNRIGLAAGLDKNGEHIDALAALGFGCIEIGTVTPRAQGGNPKPRLFRLANQQALINRMGFNNKGVDYLLAQIKQARYRGILGINIGKNKDTPADKGINDYLECMQKAYAYAGYLAINISSPNTPGLRNMQNAGELETLLAELTRLRTVLRAQSGRYVPLALKVAPDLSAQQIDDITRATVDYGIDALIVGNTTVERPGIAGAHAHETGGLSGKPLLPLATRTLQSFAQRLQGKIPLIGVGGISSGADAVAKIKAGATLIQIYSGLIYRGPGLLGEISKALKKTRE